MGKRAGPLRPRTLDIVYISAKVRLILVLIAGCHVNPSLSILRTHLELSSLKTVVNIRLNKLSKKLSMRPGLAIFSLIQNFAKASKRRCLILIIHAVKVAFIFHIIFPLLDIHLPVYSCNIKGAKTCYSETACMNLERDQTVTLDITGDIHQLFACVTEGGTFDAEKWASLDQSRLAFKCDETGKAINGLFA